MKKFLALSLFFLCLGLVAFSQERTYYNSTMTATVLEQEDADTVNFPVLLLEPWDVSVQFKATSVSGDSVDAVIDVQQSNATSGDIWHEIVSDSSTTLGGTWLYELQDFQGLRLRFILTGDNEDTASYTGYYVIKRPLSEVPGR